MNVSDGFHGFNFQWMIVNFKFKILECTQMQHVWRWAHKRQMWICWWTFCMQSKSLNYETWEIKCTRRIFRTFECSEWMHSKVAPNVGDKVQTCFCVNTAHIDQKSSLGKVKHSLWWYMNVEVAQVQIRWGDLKTSKDELTWYGSAQCAL